MSMRMGGTRGAALAPFALVTLLLTGAGGCTQGGTSGTAGTPATGGTDGWAGAAFVTPAEVAAQLADATGPRPMLIHVGFKVLYKAGAIPGTVYLGPGSREEGLAALREAVKAVPHERDIVIYCGCCPWEDCPNMRPAYAAMQQMGFTHVRAMKIAKNFDTDWAGHGYPVEKPAD